ncbi:hypothetical protein [Bacillus sp. AFS096315]|uniref:hypothetical protein n=1 Tax=Bacillus sp. AFS096315 TaxID=2033517 RepID=UPI001144989F|nr:hypothetical protein [Bacillus sp. AFS096315]
MQQINYLFSKLHIDLASMLNQYPAYTLGGIDMVSNILGIFWSISLTVYFFAYRERKSIAISSNVSAGNISFTIGLGLILFNTLYGKAFAIPFDKNNMGSFYADHFNYIRLLIWGILTLSSLFYGINIIRRMLNSIDLRNLLKLSITNITVVMNQIMILNKESVIRESLFKYLISSIETYYQTLIVAVEKNMMEVYNESFNSLEKLASLLNEGVTQEMLDFLDTRLNVIVPTQLLNSASENDYISLHKTLLLHHVALIKSLHDNNRHAEIQTCINTFFTLEPSDQFPGLRKDFHTNLHQLIMYLDSKKTIVFRTGIEELEQFCLRELLQEPTQIGGLRIYKHLLLNAVEQGDTNLISYLVYSMKRLINRHRSKNTSTSITSWTRSVHAQGNVQPEGNNQSFVETAIIYLIFQILLKSVEISKYPVTGFLIKYLITNHCQDDILKETFKLFTKNNGDDQFLSSAKLGGKYYSEIKVDLVFNEETIEYCMQKMTIIIYTQQVFSIENSLPGSNNAGAKIDLDLVKAPKITDNSYLKYLVSKIKNAGDKFGLISLEKTEEYFNLNKEEEAEAEAVTIGGDT